MIVRMCADDAGNESFEDMVRSIAEEVGRSVERVVNQVDVGEFADVVGVDPDRAREWVESAGSWLRSRAEGLGDEVAARGAWPQPEPRPQAEPQSSRRAAPDVEDPLRSAGPSALDLPTDEQGLALAALESGRWIVEPGSNALASRGDGPGPSDALDLYRELLVRDWISTDGEVTLAGHHALSRWLDAAAR
jgi:hypothetical protein